MITLLRRACALALVGLAVSTGPALAQTKVGQPGAVVSQSAAAYGALGATATAVTDTNGLPVKLTGFDSVTQASCIIGSVSTCSLQTSGGSSGGGDASAANQTAVQTTVGAGAAPAKANVGGGLYNSGSVTLTNGQSIALQLDAHGHLGIVLYNPDGSQVDPAAAQTIQGSLKILDAAGSNTATVKAASTPAAATDTAQVFDMRPIGNEICTKVSPINQTSSTDLTGSVTNKVHVCGLLAVQATVQSLSITEGTGSACATGAAALIGSTTAANGMPFAANGGWNALLATPWLKSLTTGDHLCLLQSGSAQVSGVLIWADQP